MGVRPGQPWGEAGRSDDPVAIDVAGDDRDLARAVVASPVGSLFRFVPGPGSDVARAVGLGNRRLQGTALPLDALIYGDGGLACNAVIAGTAPDRLAPWSRRFPVTVTVDGAVVFRGKATTVVVATGEFLRGLDLSPRGHPGDGRAEVQIYAVPAGERRALRARLRTGTHLPHSRIGQRTGRRILIEAVRPQSVEADGHPVAAAAELGIAVVPGAYRLLV